MSAPNPALVDLAIDLLEEGVDVPFTLSPESSARLETELKKLTHSDELLSNVIGLLELAQHAEDYAFDQVASALREVAETSADALNEQGERIRRARIARLGFATARQAPQTGARAPEHSFKASQLIPPSAPPRVRRDVAAAARGRKD